MPPRRVHHELPRLPRPERRDALGQGAQGVVREGPGEEPPLIPLGHDGPVRVHGVRFYATGEGGGFPGTIDRHEPS